MVEAGMRHFLTQLWDEERRTGFSGSACPMMAEQSPYVVFIVL